MESLQPPRRNKPLPQPRIFQEEAFKVDYESKPTLARSISRKVSKLMKTPESRKTKSEQTSPLKKMWTKVTDAFKKPKKSQLVSRQRSLTGQSYRRSSTRDMVEEVGLRKDSRYDDSRYPSRYDERDERYADYSRYDDSRYDEGDAREEYGRYDSYDDIDDPPYGKTSSRHRHDKPKSLYDVKREIDAWHGDSSRYQEPARDWKTTSRDSLDEYKSLYEERRPRNDVDSRSLYDFGKNSRQGYRDDDFQRARRDKDYERLKQDESFNRARSDSRTRPNLAERPRSVLVDRERTYKELDKSVDYETYYKDLDQSRAYKEMDKGIDRERYKEVDKGIDRERYKGMDKGIDREQTYKELDKERNYLDKNVDRNRSFKEVDRGTHKTFKEMNQKTANEEDPMDYYAIHCEPEPFKTSLPSLTKRDTSRTVISSEPCKRTLKKSHSSLYLPKRAIYPEDIFKSQSSLQDQVSLQDSYHSQGNVQRKPSPMNLGAFANRIAPLYASSMDLSNHSSPNMTRRAGVYRAGSDESLANPWEQWDSKPTAKDQLSDLMDNILDFHDWVK